MGHELGVASKAYTDEPKNKMKLKVRLDGADGNERLPRSITYSVYTHQEAVDQQGIKREIEQEGLSTRKTANKKM